MKNQIGKSSLDRSSAGSGRSLDRSVRPHSLHSPPHPHTEHVSQCPKRPSPVDAALPQRLMEGLEGHLRHRPRIHAVLYLTQRANGWIVWDGMGWNGIGGVVDISRWSSEGSVVHPPRPDVGPKPRSTTDGHPSAPNPATLAPFHRYAPLDDLVQHGLAEEVPVVLRARVLPLLRAGRPQALRLALEGEAEASLCGGRGEGGVSSPGQFGHTNFEPTEPLFPCPTEATTDGPPRTNSEQVACTTRTEQGMWPSHLVCGWVSGWVDGY